MKFVAVNSSKAAVLDIGNCQWEQTWPAQLKKYDFKEFLHTEVRDEWFCYWENLFPNIDELFHCDTWPLIERLDHSPALLT